MKAQEFFRELKQIENQIESKKYMAETYRTLAEGVSSPIYSDMPKSPNRKLEPMADALSKALELEEEVVMLEQELNIKRGKLMDLILHLDKDYQIILIKRYFENKTWGQIATSMYYSERWVYKLHGTALKEMDEYIKSSVEFMVVQYNSAL